MKQKIIIQVHMHCNKCRTKALKMAAVANGLDFVGLQGAEKDQVVVIGEQVDSVYLASRLRKKIRHAKIISVEEVKPEQEVKKPTIQNPVQPIHKYIQYPQFENFVVIDDYPYPGNNCCQI